MRGRLPWAMMAVLVGASIGRSAQAPDDAEALRSEAERAAGKVSLITGTDPGSPPPVVRIESPERLDSLSRHRVPADRIAARGRAWADIGLGGEETPRALLALLARDLESVVFDSARRRIVVGPGVLTSDDFAPSGDDDLAATLLSGAGVRPGEPLLAHALVHAAQEARRKGAEGPETTDAILASAAWEEGEANLVAVLYLFGGLGLEKTVLESRLDPTDVMDGRLVPSRLSSLAGVERGLAEFVYVEGYVQASDRVRKAGFRGLSKASASRVTTRDVLHSDRPPLQLVPFPDPPPPKSGVSIVERDTVGEQGIVTLVSVLTGKDNLALMAGDGWEGDTLFRYEGPPGRGRTSDGTTVWKTRWASDDDASDFDYALRRSIEARFPGSSAVGDAKGSWVLRAATRRFALQRSGRYVDLTVAPDPAPNERTSPPPGKPSQTGPRPSF